MAVLDEDDEPRSETVIPKRQAVRALFGTNPGTEELWGDEEMLAEIEEAMR